MRVGRRLWVIEQLLPACDFFALRQQEGKKFRPTGSNRGVSWSIDPNIEAIPAFES